MEYNFFKAQWDYPCPKDWTLKVKQDLADLGLPISLKFITSKSEKNFKELVKVKVKELEFKELMGQRTSKSKNIMYENLKLQKYLKLETANKKQAIILFKFRTRMSPFGENFRSGKQSTICPFCLSHVDSQEKSMDCPTLRKELRINGNYQDLFSKDIPVELVQTLFDIYAYRKENE